MADVEDRGDRARVALERGMAGLQSDLRQHRRGHVVPLGVVRARERLSAILSTLSTTATPRRVNSGTPAEHLDTARAAVVFLVEHSEALDLSAHQVLLLARAAHALSASERILVPGAWEAR